MGQSYSYNGGQTFTYDALGKQVTSNWDGLQQNYDDGDGLRAKKVMNGVATYYLRSSVLGGQVVSEIDASGLWTRGYVYLGLQLVAVQYAGMIWVHQDPVTKGQRLVNINGTLESTIELDPFGGDTNRSVNASFQPRHFTTDERDTVGGMDEAMARRYHGWWSRFSQPDPYDGSYSLADPQSFNRYAYVQNDPLVAEIAGRNDTAEGFMDEIARTFTAANNSSRAEIRRNLDGVVPPGRTMLGDGGFRDSLRDGTGLQVRHFVGGLLYGYRYGYGTMVPATALEAISPAPAGSMADVRLNELSMRWGTSMEPRPPSVTGYMGATVSTPAHPGYRGLADLIRRDICQ